MVNTFCKIHLIDNLQYKKLKPYKALVADATYTEFDFIDLPKLTDEELILLQEKNEEVMKKVKEYKETQNARNKIRKFIFPYILKKLSQNLKNDIPRLK
jgi:hypothetical protein